MELSKRHIRNLKIVTDRSRLLKYMPHGGIVAELGVCRGDYSLEIYNECQPDELHLVDTWCFQTPKNIKFGEHDLFGTLSDKAITEERFKGKSNVFLHQQDDLDYLLKLPDNFFDWIYLDTVHLYEHTVKELELLKRVVKKEGYIAGHDYVSGFYHPTFNQWHQYGVIQAVHEFCHREDYEMVYLTNEASRMLSWVIKKIPLDKV